MDIVSIIVASAMYSIMFFFNDKFREKEGYALKTAVLFSTLAAIVKVILMLFNGKEAFQFSYFSFIIASVAAIFSIMLCCASFIALNYANLAVYSLFSMLGGMLVPVVFSVIFLNEVLSWQNAVCIIFLIVGFTIGLIASRGTCSSKSFPSTPYKSILSSYVGIYMYTS